MVDVRLRVAFFQTESGTEPVRDWLLSLGHDDRKTIGEDIKTVQFGWPLVRKLGVELWEVRSRLENRIARVIFTVQDSMIVLLHGFIKKSQKTPIADLNTAKTRLAQLKERSL